MTFLVVISFMIRCTSIIGFAPIVLIKIFEDKSLYTYVQAGLFIAIPTFILLIAIDSYYYECFTFVPYNFLQQNIVENVSAQFGVSPVYYYFTYSFPHFLNLLYPISMSAIAYNIYSTLENRQFPYMPMFWLTYISVFSAIGHKEDRFLLPLMPIIFLLSANFIVTSP